MMLKKLKTEFFTVLQIKGYAMGLLSTLLRKNFQLKRQLIVLGLIALCLPINTIAFAEGEDDSLWRRPTFEKKVYEVGQRLLQANGIDTHIAFRVESNDQINAYAQRWPGRSHNVVMFKGLLDYIASDDELAAILGHEIAHIVRRHSYKVSVKRMGAWTGGVALATLAGMAGADNDTMNSSVNLSRKVSNRFSKKYEREADQLSVHYLVKAGYNPLAIESVMNKISGDAGPLTRFFATHPMGEKRLIAVRQEIKTAYPQFLSPAVASNKPGAPFAFQPNNNVIHVTGKPKARHWQEITSSPESVVINEKTNPIEISKKSQGLETQKLPQQPFDPMAVENNKMLKAEDGISVNVLALKETAIPLPEDNAIEQSTKVGSGSKALYKAPERISYGFGTTNYQRPKAKKAQQAAEELNIAKALLLLNEDEKKLLQQLIVQEFIGREALVENWPQYSVEQITVMAIGLEDKGLVRIIGHGNGEFYVLSDDAVLAFKK